jgi:nucleoid-associated protein YgaU
MLEGVRNLIAKIFTPTGTAGQSGSAQSHTVVKGDTLSAIAQRYYGRASEYPRIFEANRDILHDPDKIYPGQVLKIPR